jgi:hypothetical protein
MMFLTFNTKEDAQEGKSSKATGAYCQLCDTHFKYDMNTNPHMVTNYAQKAHAKDMMHLHQEKAEREANNAHLKRSKTVKQSCLNMFAQSDVSKLPMASQKELATFRYKAAVWVGARLLPFAHVQDSELQDMIDYASVVGKKQLTLPSCQEASIYARHLAESIWEVMKQHMIQEIEYYALTTDMWTSCSMDTYITTTIHYLTNDFKLKQYTLDVNPFHGRHTADLIQKKMSHSLFQSWGLKKVGSV